MTQLDILLNVVEKLNNLNIPYMLTGAYAVSFYGKPRTTHDIDLKIEIRNIDIDNIFNSFKNSFYVSKEMIEDAVKRKLMFNIIENETQTKIDFWIVKDTDYDKTRFSRKILTKIKDVNVNISSAEDTVLIKLVWFKDSQLQKHIDDALGIIEVQRKKLDIYYLTKWSKILSVNNILSELFSKINPPL